MAVDDDEPFFVTVRAAPDAGHCSIVEINFKNSPEFPHLQSCVEQPAEGRRFESCRGPAGVATCKILSFDFHYLNSFLSNRSAG
jgi:hypothetical protein